MMIDADLAARETPPGISGTGYCLELGKDFYEAVTAVSVPVDLRALRD